MSSVLVCPGGGLRDSWGNLLEKTFNTGGKDWTFKHKEADTEDPCSMYVGLQCIIFNPGTLTLGGFTRRG